MSASGSPRRRALITALKLALGLAILALVARIVPWRDRLQVVEGETVRQLEGAIEGDWKSDTITFRFREPLAPELVPQALRTEGATNALEQVEVTRTPSTSWTPGMPTAFLSVDPRGLALALALAVVGILATALRWWRLLRAAGCPTELWPAVRMTFVGFFFNIVVPGLTGGDLVKAVMVARSHPERRAAAAMSVLVDRLLGVLVMVTMGAVAIVWLGERFPYPREPILIALALGVGGLAAYANPALRKRVGFERLIARLPWSGTITQIDQALTVCAREPRELGWAVCFSLFNQFCVMGALTTLGASFGENALQFPNYVVVGALGNLVSALPLTPGGVGVAEAAYGQLFEMQGGNWTLGFAVAIAWRLCLVLVGLGGGLFLLMPGGRLSAAERAQVQGSSDPRNP